MIRPHRGADTLIPRLENKIERIPESGCWLWTAAITGTGYGYVRDGNRMRVAHRMVYEAMRGPIPKGLDLDHLCRVRSCVNPAHLEPVTRSVNVQRGNPGAWMKRRAATLTHCPQGPPYFGENLYVTPDGRRVCRICTREAGRRHDAKRRRSS